MVQRVKTSQEIREEYENIARAREELTNPAQFHMTVNATDLFDRYLYEHEPVYDEQGGPT